MTPGSKVSRVKVEPLPGGSYGYPEELRLRLVTLSDGSQWVEYFSRGLSKWMGQKMVPGTEQGR